MLKLHCCRTYVLNKTIALLSKLITEKHIKTGNIYKHCKQFLLQHTEDKENVEVLFLQNS